MSSVSASKVFLCCRCSFSHCLNEGSLKVNEYHSLGFLAVYMATKDTYCEIGRNSHSGWCVRKDNEHVRRKAGECQVFQQFLELYLWEF